MKTVCATFNRSDPFNTLLNGTAEHHQYGSLDVLRSLYRRTQAETRPTAALANGHSLEKIADTVRLGKNIVCAQLKPAPRKPACTGRRSWWS